MALELTLKDRHALVCGASSGIGRAAAVQLASMHARVTVLARRAELLRELAEELEAAGSPSASYLVVDVEDRLALETAISGLFAERGHVHVLINNSGGPPSGPILEASPDDFLKSLNRHLIAAHLLTQMCLPGMQADHYGRIINVISTSVKEPIPGLGVSNTTRGAVASWAKSVSRELPPGITINNVLPGYTATDRLDSLAEQVAERGGKTKEDVHADWLAKIPEGRLGKPYELAATIAFLASPAASYIRGQSLAVDGGRMMSI